jgi:hypothetical protein
MFSFDPTMFSFALRPLEPETFLFIFELGFLIVSGRRFGRQLTEI